MKKSRLSSTARYMLYALAGLFVCFLIVGVVIATLVYPFEAPLAYGVGLALGSAVSGVKIILLEKSLWKSSEMDNNHASNYGTTQFLMRQALTIGVLVVSVIFRQFIGLVGTVLGIVSMQFSAYIASIMLKKKGYPME